MYRRDVFSSFQSHSPKASSAVPDSSLPKMSDYMRIQNVFTEKVRILVLKGRKLGKRFVLVGKQKD